MVDAHGPNDGPTCLPGSGWDPVSGRRSWNVWCRYARTGYDKLRAGSFGHRMTAHASIFSE